MPKLILKKDGFLYRIKDSYDVEKDEISYEESDVTCEAIFYLNDCLEIEEGVTLKHFFIMVNKNLDLLEVVFGNWMREYTDEIINGTPESIDEDNYSLECLKLFWNVKIDKKGNSIELPHWPEFVGVGHSLVDDSYYQKGDEILWGVGLAAIKDFADYPLVLDPEVKVWSDDVHSYENAEYTLYQVIQGIMWEISFYGDPKDTNSFNTKLLNMVEAFKNDEDTFKHVI